MKRWAEHFIIIPLRWYKKHYLSWKNHNQRCKLCGCRDKFNFNVDDEIWTKVVPAPYQHRVICLSCFDELAKKNEVDYSTSIKELYFAGDCAVMMFSKDGQQQ